MNKRLHIQSDEKGSVLVISLILLMMLTLIGIAITTTASLELQISGNEKLSQIAFYKADGGTEVGYELLEQNLGCANGFANATITGDNSAQSVQIANSTFWQDTSANVPTVATRDFFFPSTNPATVPRTDFTVGGNTQMSTGSAIQMVSGYEGKGKAAGAGGAFIMYDMYSQHLGVNSSQSIILVQWRHVIGQEGSCNY
jgi:hypothetical protein